MRILITTESRSTAGGIEKYLQALAPRLLQDGHELGWLFGDSPYTGVGADAFQGKKKWIAERQNRKEVRSQISSWNPEVVYANGIRDSSWDRWLTSRYPTAYFAHAFYGACISGYKCHSNPNVVVCKRKLGPSCLLLFFPRRCGGRNPIRMLSNYFLERKRQRNLRNFRFVLVASQYMAEEYCRQGVDVERIKILPLFAPDSSPDPECPTLRSWTNCIAMVSRLTDLKGVGLVAEAVAIASKKIGRPLRFCVAGAGPGQDELRRQAIIHDVETRFLGWLDSASRNNIYRQADALIVPSIWPEPFGLVGIEAGCVGLPSVAFDVGGIPDWLEAGVSGELASGNPATAEGLGLALARALASHEHHQQLRVNAWHSSKRFSIESHIAQLSNILNEIKN